VFVCFGDLVVWLKICCLCFIGRSAVFVTAICMPRGLRGVLILQCFDIIKNQDLKSRNYDLIETGLCSFLTILGKRVTNFVVDYK
jgi:hypothetical protein